MPMASAVGAARLLLMPASSTPTSAPLTAMLKTMLLPARWLTPGGPRK